MAKKIAKKQNMNMNIMKYLPGSTRVAITVMTLLCITVVDSFAQWTASGTNQYSGNTGNVGVGTGATMTAKFEVVGPGTSTTPMILRQDGSSSTFFATFANATAPQAHTGIQINRSGGTYAAPTDVGAGQRIGGFYGQPRINGSYRGSASIEMHVGASPGASSYPASIRFETTANGSTTRTERMRITEDGVVGINTATPGASYKLDVNGGINATAFFLNGAPLSGGGGSQWTTSGNNASFGLSGNVGIGTSSPAGKLEINYAGGQLRLSGGTVPAGVWTDAADRFYLADWATGTKGLQANLTTGNVGIGSSPHATYKLDVNGTINASSLYVNGQPFSGSQWTTSGSNAYFGLSGNVGIGSANPDAKLTVNGTVHAKEVRVDLSVPGPDYVFDKDYKLLSLEDVNAYIEKHHHLPEVPSAAEMEKNGISLSEMNMILLKKVEELTLYLLEQDAIIKSQSERLSKLEKRNK